MGKNTLPPQVEERLRAIEAHQKRVSKQITSLDESLDQVISEIDLADGEEWEDPSVVRDAEGVNLAAAGAATATR